MVAPDSEDCLSFNPGNIGTAFHAQEMIQASTDFAFPIRLGVNGRALAEALQNKYGEPSSPALVESAQRHV